MLIDRIIRTTSKVGDKAQLSFKDIPITDLRRYSIPEMCRGKRVLVIGCVDMSDMVDIKNEISKGLHQFHNISEVADYCLGLDINPDGIKTLDKLGYHAKYLDITSNTTIPELQQDFDFVVLSHIIEHVVDLSGFINSVILKVNCHKFIFAVPNAYNVKHAFPILLLQKENVSNDHYYTFTPITFMKLLNGLGFQVEKIYLDQDRNIKFGKSRPVLGLLWSIIKNKIFKHSGDIIAIAKHKNN